MAVRCQVRARSAARVRRTGYIGSRPEAVAMYAAVRAREPPAPRICHGEGGMRRSGRYEEGCYVVAAGVTVGSARIMVLCNAGDC